ncbi:hypothetical protein ACL02R_14340 [Streptomyces sp. MS19]|uniref:hypothetical protein n=1 Tax=Streptomyces sp. MS19 TaxID=3385972 RepID=UPI00399F3200
MTSDDAAALDWLRAHRGKERRRRFGYRAYVTALLLVSWFGLYGAGLVAQIDRGGPFADHADRIRDALPLAVPALALTAVCVALADALWRGPVTLPRADADWLLPMPLPRWRLLRPWLLLSAALLSLVGLLAGLGTALVVAAARLAGLGTSLLACVPPALCLALLTAAGAVAVERYAPAARTVRLFLGPAFLAVLLLVSLLLRGGTLAAPLQTVLLWSGPWGWAAQPMIAAAGLSAPGWQVAAALLLCCTVASLLPLRHLTGSLPAATLRTRSHAAGRAVAGLVSFDLRTAWQAVAAASGSQPPRAWRRLRVPRHPLVAVLWRDALGLLSRPQRLITAALLLGGAFLTAAVTTGTDGTSAFVLLAAAASLAVAAAGALLEPARLDADDPRRGLLWWPRSAASLALAHAVAPTVALLLAGLAPALPLTLATDTPAATVLTGAVPLLVAGALLDAYRPPPSAVLLHRAMTGSGGTVLIMLRQSAGQAIAILGTLLAAGRTLTGTSPDGMPAPLVCWPLAAALLAWTTRRARAALGPDTR